MNEKEAREILEKSMGDGSWETNYAKGYLERVAQEKDRMLEGKAYEAKGYLERERALAIKESACVQCTPGGRTVVKNFLCAYHKTVKFLSGKPVKFHINKFTP